MTDRAFFDSLDAYFERTLAAHGPTPRGVDWNGQEAQELRFRELLRVIDGSGPVSLNDYGCGYGALAPFAAARGLDMSYTGFDVSKAMLSHARELVGDGQPWRFVHREQDLPVADYTVASGLFNLRLEVGDDSWAAYVERTIRSLGRLSRRGLAFNMLTRYSDPERMRPDLYYADPGRFFDLCKREISPHVALHHDYGLYEFTLLVRMEPREP